MEQEISDAEVRKRLKVAEATIYELAEKYKKIGKHETCESVSADYQYKVQEIKQMLVFKVKYWNDIKDIGMTFIGTSEKCRKYFHSDLKIY